MPEAFYRIQDSEAQRFVGKCLETVSKRLPAKDLLLDPFLACDEGELLLVPKAPNQKLIPDGTVVEQVQQFVVDSDHRKSTDMTITGSMNPEDDTIFLKVQIIDKDGRVLNCLNFLLSQFSDNQHCFAVLQVIQGIYTFHLTFSMTLQPTLQWKW